jgi:hypothetical protein
MARAGTTSPVTLPPRQRSTQPTSLERGPSDNERR